MTSFLTITFSVTIINLFSEQIEKMVTLAVLLPIIAGLTANTASQSLTVLVRNIATNKIANINITKILFKEIIAGSLNGLMVSILAFITCYIWKNNLLLSLIFMISIFLLLL